MVFGIVDFVGKRNGHIPARRLISPCYRLDLTRRILRPEKDLWWKIRKFLEFSNDLEWIKVFFSEGAKTFKDWKVEETYFPYSDSARNVEKFSRGGKFSLRWALCTRVEDALFLEFLAESPFVENVFLWYLFPFSICWLFLCPGIGLAHPCIICHLRPYHFEACIIASVTYAFYYCVSTENSWFFYLHLVITIFIRWSHTEPASTCETGRQKPRENLWNTPL